MARLSKKDVVIVGLGAAGGIASYVLAQAGLDVVGIEAGPRLSNKDFLKRLDEIGEDFSIRNSLGGPKFNREVPTWRPNVDTPTSAPVAVGMAELRGWINGSLHRPVLAVSGERLRDPLRDGQAVREGHAAVGRDRQRLATWLPRP